MALQQWTRPDIRRIEVSGIPVAVEQVRNGDRTAATVAWVHGLGSASTLGFAQASRHSSLSGVTSYLIDLPGFGLSGKPADWPFCIEGQAAIVRDVLKAVTDQPVTLFGHSMGGSVAIACATIAPGAAGRVIVAEPTLEPGIGVLSAHIAAQRESRFVERGYRSLLRAVEREARSGRADSFTFLETLRVASPVAMHRSAVSLLAERSPTFREQLEALAMPRVWLGGEQSAPTPPSLDAAIETRIIPKAGHDMVADNLDGFTATLAELLGIR